MKEETMAKLTKIQLTTFIDIISQDNYRAPLYYSSIEQGIERKGLISLHKDRSVRLTKAGEQLANEINKRRETQDLAHMSIDERQLFLSNIAEQGLKDEAVIQLSKDRNAELRLRGVRLLIKRGLLDQKQATKFAHDKSSEIRALMVGKADLMEFIKDESYEVHNVIRKYISENNVNTKPFVDKIAHSPQINQRLFAVDLAGKEYIPLLLNDYNTNVRCATIDRFADSLDSATIDHLIADSYPVVREYVARKVNNLTDAQIQRLLHDRVAGFWMQNRLDEYCKTYRRLFYLEKLFADVKGDMACSQREESLQR